MKFEQTPQGAEPQRDPAYLPLEDLVGQEIPEIIRLKEDDVPEAWKVHLGKIWFRGKAKRVRLNREHEDRVRDTRLSLIHYFLPTFYNFVAEQAQHFNGMMVRLSGIQLDGDVLVIQPKLIDYFTYLLGWYKRRESSTIPNPNVLVIGVRVLTANGDMVFARRTQNVSTGNGHVGNIGGCFNFYDKEQGRENWDPQALARDEVLDELLSHEFAKNLGEEELVPEFEGLGQDRLKRPVLIYTVRLPLSTDELIPHFHSANAATEKGNEIVEHDELVIVSNTREGILKEMQKSSPDGWHEPANLILGMALQDVLKQK